MNNKKDDYILIAKIICVMVLSLTFVIVTTLGARNLSDFLNDKKTVAEINLMNTEHIQGEVIEKKDKSYIKKEGSVLLIGGGERKVEDYEIKVKYDKTRYKTIKLKENEYLDINESDKLNIIIDSEDHSIKYNLDDNNDREKYESYKKELNEK